MTDPFMRFGAAMARWRWVVLVLWLVLLGGAGALAQRAPTVLKAGGFIVPGSESGETGEVLSKQFNASTTSSVAVVFRSDNLTVDTDAFRTEVVEAIERVSKLPEVSSIDSFFTTGNPLLVSADRHTAVANVSLTGDEGDIENFSGKLRPLLLGGNLETLTTGLPAVNFDIQKTSEHDLKRAEIFTIPIVLVLLLLVFRTVLSAMIPLVLGAAAVVTAVAIIFVIGSLTTTSIFAMNVTSMIGLGLGIDFSLIVVNRFREEMAAGRPPRDAVAYTMATAGRSITYSAVTVMAGMLVLTLMLARMMSLRSISMAVLLVAFTALLSGLTLLPALLAILGPKLEWLPVLPRRRATTEGGEEEAQGIWYRISHAIMRRPWLWLAASSVILLIMALPIIRMELIGSTPGVLPAETESVRGVAALNQAFGANRLTPIQITVQAPERDGAWKPEFLEGLAKLHEVVAADHRSQDTFSLATLPSFVTGPDGLPPGITSQALIQAAVEVVPAAPAFVGLARFTVPSGFDVPSRAYESSQIVRPESGELRFTVGGPATLIRAKDASRATPGQQAAPPKGEQPPLDQPFTLAAGDQLVILPNTPVAMRNASAEPAVTLAVSMFIIRGTTQSQTTWTENNPAIDLFARLPRQVLTGAVVTETPARGGVIALDRLEFTPGTRIPRHTHPGTELLAFESGSFTIFEAPPDEMTITTADGRDAEGIPGSPASLTAGARAVVQSRQIHRALERRTPKPGEAGGEPMRLLSLRLLAADEPSFQLADPPRNSPPAFMKQLPKELFVADDLAKATTARFININGNNDTAVLTIIPRFPQYSDETKQFVRELRGSIIPGIPEVDAYEVKVGGDTAVFLDFRDTLYNRFPLLGAAVMFLTFIILMMFFQSVFLPIKAILMNLASILATYGVLVLIFKYGWGHELFNFEPIGALAVITPVILFVILFGLSTDYEVFMLSRVKEYYHETGNNEEAVAKGLQHTAGVITAAGLILVGTFGSFASADVVIVKEIGLGLAIGVLIDSTIIRVIMVPATMRLAGNLNWWMPAWLKKIVPELKEGPSLSPAPVGAAVMAGAAGGYAEPVNSAPARYAAAPASGAGFTRAFRLKSSGNGTMTFNQHRVGALRPTGGAIGADLVVLPQVHPFRMGRDDDNELQLYDQRISRKHARIDYVDGVYLLHDLDSSNGVYVNGAPIAGPTPLRHGDLVEIGNSGTITFAFEQAGM